MCVHIFMPMGHPCFGPSSSTSKSASWPLKRQMLTVKDMMPSHCKKTQTEEGSCAGTKNKSQCAQCFSHSL